jgi:hypothetical protein
MKNSISKSATVSNMLSDRRCWGTISECLVGNKCWLCGTSFPRGYRKILPMESAFIYFKILSFTFYRSKEKGFHGISSFGMP